MFIQFESMSDMCISNNESLAFDKVVPRKTHRRPLVEEPLTFDVLCGKSRQCISHDGTRFFRHVIDQYRSRYQEARSKQERMDITKEIVGSIGAKGGRFLKFNPVLQSWEVSCRFAPLWFLNIVVCFWRLKTKIIVFFSSSSQNIGHLAARDKVSHALRCANQKQPTSPIKKVKKAYSQKSKSNATSDASSDDSDGSVSSHGSSALCSRGYAAAAESAMHLHSFDSREMEEAIGDEQSMLSWFSSREMNTDCLPSAAALVSTFEHVDVSCASINDVPRYSGANSQAQGIFDESNGCLANLGYERLQSRLIGRLQAPAVTPVSSANFYGRLSEPSNYEGLDKIPQNHEDSKLPKEVFNWESV